MSTETFPGNPRDMKVSANPELSAEEKETTVTVDNDRDRAHIHTDIPVHIRWILSLQESEITGYNTVSGKLCGIRAYVPKGYIKLQGKNRKSQTNGSMVSYGSVDHE